jgi:hypothetical protein
MIAKAPTIRNIDKDIMVVIKVNNASIIKSSYAVNTKELIS